jgi:aminocarboxymuconate-semialdehyde decarboxylase
MHLLEEGGTARMAFAGEASIRPIMPRMSCLEDRKEWLVRQKIDHPVVGGWTDVYGYDLPGKEGAVCARFLNEHLQKDGDVLAALTPRATVPLQNGAFAACVLEEPSTQGSAAR